MLRLIVLVIAMVFAAGCGSSSSKEVYISSIDNFNDGVVVEDTNIELSDKVKMSIPEGTEFVDEEGNPITEAPEAKVEVAKGGKAELKSEIDLSSNGKKVIPSKPITISLPAPDGAKPGDKVKIDVPDGVKANKISQKLIILTVNSNGTINLVILPEVFKKQTVLVIVIKPVDISTD